MPSRSDAIRRCAFKLPKNDRYQCQKTGDKYQLGMKMWYCRFHDCHAQDRCQVLVEWAGTGAQCEQLGHLDEKTGKKLCKWHAMSSKGDGGLQMQGLPHNMRKDSIQGNVEQVNTPKAKKQHKSLMHSATPLIPLSSATRKEQTDHAPCLAQIDAKLKHLPNKETTYSSSQTKEQVPPAPIESVEAEITNDNGPPCLATLDMEEFATTAIEEASVLIRTPAVDIQAIDERTLFVAQTVEAATEPVTRKVSDEPRDLGRAARTRVNSLEPATTFSIPRGETVISTPTAAAHVAYQDIQSFGTAESAHSTPYRSVYARISLLNAFQTQEAFSPTRIVAIYVQCCVCLEKHGEYNMRQVEPCNHRYRDLCLRKATKIGELRRFNCSSCKAWIEERRRDTVKHGRL